MKLKAYKNLNYVKVYESQDGSLSVGLRGSLNKYYIELIYYNKKGIGFETKILKEYKGILTDIKSQALKDLTKIKKDVEVSK